MSEQHFDFAKILRPQSLEEFAGQKKLLGEGGALRKLIEKRAFFHAFFFGPPGTGKTTLARIISNNFGLICFEKNATSLQISELRAIVEANKNSLSKPLIFIDETHRLSKNQLEILLPVMENNDAMIIGASTENPFFALTGAVRSRSLLFEFKPLEREDLTFVLDRAILMSGAKIGDSAREYLLDSAAGDARSMLKLLEFALLAESGDELRIETLRSLRPNALNDGSSESETHYNLASAMIKSLRGSDPDAAIYYLARLLKGGEEPRFIARRLAIFASEDIGNANPQAAILTSACFNSVAQIGMPEARIILSQCAIYLACSPKSNTAITAIDDALLAIGDGLILEVPDYLKDAHYDGAKKLGRGEGYKYPHNFGGYVKQNYLNDPKGIARFVELKAIGYEKTLAEWLEKLRDLDR
ncbi:MAG: replication-associated recombination protein A [Helicobacteraceae bacterium]|jgi:putative ATPase|nr:replication-associated recombination protein A [Helicobacteraceae bacterium]